jgi:outer membrane lipoprotein-sorting protein
MTFRAKSQNPVGLRILNVVALSFFLLSIDANSSPAQTKAGASRTAARKSVDESGELRTTLAAIDKLWFGSRSTANVTMTVKTEHYERVLKLTYWVEGKDQTLLRIDAPPKEKGTSTLKLGQDIYNYLPKIARTVKVSAALRTGSWMGSHFTNDDLLKASRFSGDYDSKLLEKKMQGETQLWTVELSPKPRAAVSWTKIIMILDKNTNTPLSQEFYDESGTKTRIIEFSDIRDLGGRQAPALVKVTPLDKPNEFTELRYLTIKRDVKFTPDFFSLSRLKNQ